MKRSGTRVLVTGGAGFIGSHLVESMVRHGYRVTIYDNFSSGLHENVDGLTDDVEIIEGDILDLDAVKKAARGKDVVSHQAAQLEITKCLDDPVDDLRTNLIGTLNVLMAARDAGVQHFINASSACIYGQAVNPPSREEGPHDPNWAYGAGKLAAEKYAAIFANDYGMHVTSLRYGIVYGPREWYGRVLTIFLKRALDGKPPVVFGQGEQVRDFIYIDDVVEVHDACLSSATVGAASYNVGTGLGTSIADLARIVLDITGIVQNVQFEEVAPGAFSTLVTGRMRLPAELGVMQLSPVKLRETFAVQDMTPLRAGIATEWKWLQENPARWTEMHY